jgi:hypothetical protein
MMPDWLDRNDLLALDVHNRDVDRLLRDTPHTGHGGQSIVEAAWLDELMDMLRREDDLR